MMVTTMNNEEQIKQALVNISNALTDNIVKRLKYDVHFIGQVVAKNENGTFEVFSAERNKTYHGIRASTSITPKSGDRVHIRETKNVPDSFLIDFIDN